MTRTIKTQAHFICRDLAHVDPVEFPEFTSGFWAITPEVADKLIGGAIFMHDTKSDPSRFGGIVKSWRPATEADTDVAKYIDRIIFTFEVTPETRVPQKWPVPPSEQHQRDWWSGLVVT